jgi:hypothetical protein
MESKKINQLATELAPDLSDLTIIGDPTTGISKKITLSQMASLFTGTVEEYANLAAFPLVGVADTIYIALDTNVLYRWNTGTSAYVELSPNIINSLVFSDANGFDGNISLVGSVATLTITTALTTGSVPFIGASGALSQDNANLFFDDTNNRLGINTNAPTTALDVFGSGIIGRINGTSTNNAFLGFASAGTNKWSIGNVQSDHRFRIYNEATTSELVSVLSTGEFGIGIANPTTKFHIDGAASALIANLDANVSVAKTLSFRSDNSARINLEVSGTESGSNAGADLFIRRYSDAGALLDTPLFIKRSTGFIGINTTTAGSPLTIRGASNTNMISLGVSGTQSVGDAMGITFTSPTYEKARIVAYNDNTGNAAGYLTFWTGGSPLTTDITERMRITSTGNVGINCTPGNTLDVNGIANFRSLIYLADGTAASPSLRFNNSNSGLFLPSGVDAIGFSVGNAERMRITNAGNVLIGCTTSDSYGGYAVLQLGGNVAGLFQTFDGTVKTAIVSNNSNTGLMGTRSNHDLRLITNDTEKMRITSGGGVCLGYTSDAGYQLRMSGYAYVGGNIVCAGDVTVGNLAGSGTRSVSVNAGGQLVVSSDSKLKQEDTTHKIEGLAEILQLKPKAYKWLNDIEERGEEARTEIGFFANEVASIIPSAAPKNNNGLYGFYDRAIIASLVKGMQEQQAQIEELKAKIK